MKTKTFDVEVEGTTALLMRKFGVKAEVNGELGRGTRKMLIVDKDPREEAEEGVYRDADGCIFAPGTWFYGMVINAGAGHKARGSRKTLRFIVPAALIHPAEEIPLLDGDGRRSKTFEVDSRPVTIPATKGRIMRHRARFNTWRCRFTLTIREEILDAATIRQLLVEGGMTIGIGDYRPEKRGPFGTFAVTSWKEVDGSSVKGSRALEKAEA